MKVCLNCYQSIPEDERVCPYCNHDMNEKNANNEKPVKRAKLVKSSFLIFILSWIILLKQNIGYFVCSIIAFIIVFVPCISLFNPFGYYDDYREMGGTSYIEGMPTNRSDEEIEAIKAAGREARNKTWATSILGAIGISLIITPIVSLWKSSEKDDESDKTSCCPVCHSTNITIHKKGYDYNWAWWITALFGGHRTTRYGAGLNRNDAFGYCHDCGKEWNTGYEFLNGTNKLKK